MKKVAPVPNQIDENNAMDLLMETVSLSRQGRDYKPSLKALKKALKLAPQVSKGIALASRNIKIGSTR